MKAKIKLNCTTKSGLITQNGYYVSLKTDMYSDHLSTFNELAKELRAWLRKNKILPKRGEMKMQKSYESRSRKNCITVYTTVVDQNPYFKAIPHSDDAVN